RPELERRAGAGGATTPRLVSRAGRRRGRPQSARPDELTALAAVATAPDPVDPLLAFLRDYREKTEPTRHILDHLLHQTFAGNAETAEPESDLLLASNPDPETIRSVLGRYPFRDVMAAYTNLMQLGQQVPCLPP